MDEPNEVLPAYRFPYPDETGNRPHARQWQIQQRKPYFNPEQHYFGQHQREEYEETRRSRTYGMTDLRKPRPRVQNAGNTGNVMPRPDVYVRPLNHGHPVRTWQREISTTFRHH